jgi:hypothetical protein
MIPFQWRRIEFSATAATLIGNYSGGYQDHSNGIWRADKKENFTAGLIPDDPFFALRAPCAVAMSRNENISRGSSRTKGKSALAGNLSDELGRV